jgi:hypothetical protein
VCVSNYASSGSYVTVDEVGWLNDNVGCPQDGQGGL